MAIKWEKLTVKSQEAVQAAQRSCGGERKSGGAAAAFDGGVAGGPRGCGDSGAGEGGRAGGAVAERGECRDCEAAEGAGRGGTAGVEPGAAEGFGAGV